MNIAKQQIQKQIKKKHMEIQYIYIKKNNTKYIEACWGNNKNCARTVNY